MPSFRWPPVIALFALVALGLLSAIGLAGTLSTGTVTACATASTPAHTIADNGTPIATIPGDTATHCETATIPTSTTTVTSPATTPSTTSTTTSTTTPTTTTPTTSTTTTSTTPSPGPGGLSERIGMNTPNVSTEGWNLTWSQKILADDGVHLFRDGAGPLNIWSSPGATPNWTYTDKLVSFVKAIPNGELLPVFANSNGWQHPSCTTSPGYKCAPDPAYYQEWSNEVVAVIDHLIAKGVAVPEIEFWNEPWCCGFWMPKSNSAAYAALLKVLAPTVWAKYPNTKILVAADYWQQGATCEKDASGNCLQWFSRVLAADTTHVINDPRIKLTTHNYVQAASPTTVRATGWSYDRYKLARQQAIAVGKSDPHVEITEMGWEASTGCVLFNDGISEATQAQYTVDAIKLAFASGYVDKVFPYEEYRGSNTGCTGQGWGYNLHRADGSARPVAGAIKSYIATAP